MRRNPKSRILGPPFFTRESAACPPPQPPAQNGHHQLRNLLSRLLQRGFFLRMRLGCWRLPISSRISEESDPNPLLRFRDEAAFLQSLISHRIKIVTKSQLGDAAILVAGRDATRSRERSDWLGAGAGGEARKSSEEGVQNPRKLQPQPSSRVRLPTKSERGGSVGSDYTSQHTPRHLAFPFKTRRKRGTGRMEASWCPFSERRERRTTLPDGQRAFAPAL